MAYMKQTNSSQRHDWWKDKTGPADVSAFVAAYRSNQREHYSAGWRRNMLLGVLIVAVLGLLGIATV